MIHFIKMQANRELPYIIRNVRCMFFKHQFLVVFLISLTISMNLYNPAKAQIDSSMLFREFRSVEHKIVKSKQKVIDRFEKKLSKTSKKYIKRMLNAEERLRREIAKIDPQKAEQLFKDVPKSYSRFKKKIGQSKKSIESLSTQGNTTLIQKDTSIYSLQFISKYFPFDSIDSAFRLSQLNQITQRTKNIQNKFDYSSDLGKFIEARKAVLKSEMQKYNLSHLMKKINKHSYYYQEYIREYKNLFQSQNVMEKKVKELLTKIPEFNQYISEQQSMNSLFAANKLTQLNSTAEGMLLQTRNSLMNEIQKRLPSNANNITSLIQSQIGKATGQLQELKNKLQTNQFTNGSIPEFTPNTQKTKPFKKRLVFDINIQFAKSSKRFPTSSDIGFSVGYKLNDGIVFGLGSAMKVGLGRGWDDVQFSLSGLSLRSYIDSRLKGSFYLTGCYERNYFKLTEKTFNGNDQIWKTSALAGLTKQIRVGKGRNAKIQILYDFFYKRNNLTTNPFTYRINYSLK